MLQTRRFRVASVSGGQVAARGDLDHREPPPPPPPPQDLGGVLWTSGLLWRTGRAYQPKPRRVQREAVPLLFAGAAPASAKEQQHASDIGLKCFVAAVRQNFGTMAGDPDAEHERQAGRTKLTIARPEELCQFLVAKLVFSCPTPPWRNQRAATAGATTPTATGNTANAELLSALPSVVQTTRIIHYFVGALVRVRSNINANLNFWTPSFEL